MQNNNNQLKKLRSAYQQHSKKADFFSLFDMIRLCNYLADLNKCMEKKIEGRQQCSIAHLHHKCCGKAITSKNTKNIRNFSNYNLSEIKNFVLAY